VLPQGWFTALSDALRESPKSTVYCVSTVDTASNPPVPRVRNVVNREFLSPSPNLPLLVATTDIRTPKVRELSSGAPITEVAWWIEDVREQYRLSGVMHLLPHPLHPLINSFPGERLAPSKDETGAQFEWEKERIRVFDEKMSGPLRAWFAHPTPGGPLQSYEDAAGWTRSLPKSYEVDDGDEATRKEVDEALRNFALMVLEPITVERLELGTVPNRRTQFRRNDQEWLESIVVP